MATRTLVVCDGCSLPIVGRGIAVHLELPDAPGASWTVLTQRTIDVHALSCLATWVDREAHAVTVPFSGAAAS